MKKVGMILGVIAIGAVSLAANTAQFNVTGTVVQPNPTLAWTTSGAWNIGIVSAGTAITANDPTQTIAASAIDIGAGSSMTITVTNASSSVASWCGLNNLVVTPAVGGTPVTVANNSPNPQTIWTETTQPAGGSKSYTFGAAFSPATNAPTTQGTIAIQLMFTGTVQSN